MRTYNRRLGKNIMIKTRNTKIERGRGREEK
jgi:hypothetical protein